MVLMAKRIGDTLLLDREFIFRVDGFDAESLDISILTEEGSELRRLHLQKNCWISVTNKLHTLYRGIHVNPRCNPPEGAIVAFDDPEKTDIRYHSFRGILVRNPPRIGSSED